MSKKPTTQTGQQLWHLLPSVYQERDNGDLADFLDAAGDLLDSILGTLKQRLADTSPDTCQSWLLPYFADLLDVNMVSPDEEGRRNEVAKAVNWRQRKGTLPTTLEIAQKVGRYERLVEVAEKENTVRMLPTVMVQEGFQRVVTTARVDLPTADLLPRGTIDFREQSCAGEIPEAAPDSRKNAFGSEGIVWRQCKPNAVPCHRDTYQDSSVRTVDMRTPNWEQGHCHPRRVLLYAEPRDGFFPKNMPFFSWEKVQGLLQKMDEPERKWEKGSDTSDEGNFSKENFDDREVVFIKQQFLTPQEQGKDLEQHRRVIGFEWKLQHTPLLMIEKGIEFVETSDGKRTVRGIGEIPLQIDMKGDHETFNNLLWQNNGTDYTIEQLAIRGTLRVHGTRGSFSQVAVENLELSTLTKIEESDESPFTVKDGLIHTLTVKGKALCRLEYCTVLTKLECAALEASDSILLGEKYSRTEQLILRYCCVPWLSETEISDSHKYDCRNAMPKNRRLFRLVGMPPYFLNQDYGTPGCGVLHPATPDGIRFGAEDGGEMGAFHHRFYCLREQAVINKLRDFLPVGLEPVLIPHQPWEAPVC